ncbi:sigma-70 family RNA polymerase sigma factor [Sphingomonas sp. So64.6b]|uniref:RNA polymerase sigma factor n=1 Tax=Sphingomonas sp. So64.6b TaxID=2997354 RepID=UPI001FCE4714|nr:sigma-70 family RNA polymerase sigma factor [Sphingomonas sp. So64.6b]
MNDRQPDMAAHIRHWRPALMSFFLKRVHNHAEAEDLTQETFARVFGGSGAEAGLHAGYIFQIAANLLRDRSRRSRVRTEQYDTVRMLYGQGVDWLDPEKIAVGRSAVAQVMRSLRDLPERTRTIFVLYRIENIDKRVIGESFGISPSAVEKHVARATVHLMTRAREVSK